MKRINLLFFIIISTFIHTASGQSGKNLTIIHAGTLLSHADNNLGHEKSIIIKNDKIIDIKDGFVTAIGQFENAEIIDLRDKFVLPGLIDSHVHLSLQINGLKTKGSSWSPADSAVRLSAADATVNATVYADRTLQAGFTTVRDLGTRSELAPAVFAIRDGIDTGKIPGPRILTAGAFLSATSGHGDLEGLREDVTGLLNPSGLCDGPAECIKAVRKQVRQGADVIKFMATGGGGESNGGPDAEPEYFANEMKAIVDTAHSFNLKAAAHAHGTAGILAALNAKADSIEHGTFLNDKTIHLFKKNKAVLVPTVAVGEVMLHMAKKKGPAAESYAKARTNDKYKGVYKAWKEGVTIALGSDAGIIPHGKNARELINLAKLGIPPVDVIKIATINSAQLLGIDEITGSIEIGKMADIIATNSSPISEIEAIENILFVMKAGKIFKNTKH